MGLSGGAPSVQATVLYLIIPSLVFLTAASLSRGLHKLDRLAVAQALHKRRKPRGRFQT